MHLKGVFGAKLEEAKQVLAELEKLIERDPNFAKEKPGPLMQRFYMITKELLDNLAGLDPQERADFDEINERYKNLSNEIVRKLT